MKAYVGICILCGGELKHKREDDTWICRECGESFDPDEVGFMDDMPPSIYRKEDKDKKRKGTR